MACDFPITIKNPASHIDASAPHYVPVPCRKCPSCLAKRSNGWIFRLLEQDKVSHTSLFCTFTYDNASFTKESHRMTAKGYLTLNKRDFQLFMKRLRKLTNQDITLKYFAVGEYGSETYRPHYHAIIFNSNQTDIEKCWPHGRVHIDHVNGATIAYTTKYMHKGRLIPLHQNDDRLPEFQLMSKGLGLTYINRNTIDFHQADPSRNFVVGLGGVKIPMPDIYRQKLYTEAQRKQHARNIQLLTLESEAKKQLEHSQRTGTPDTYYRDQAESKRSAVITFRDRQKSRNKI